MTKITANVILLVMAAVWAAISLHDWKMAEVSQNFIILAAALASGEGITTLTNKYKEVKNEIPSNTPSNKVG